MDYGTAGTIVGAAWAAAGVAITVILRPRRNNDGKFCGAHSGIEVMLKSLSDGQSRIEKSIERIFELHEEGKL